MKPLPTFISHHHDYVARFIAEVLTHPDKEDTYFIDLVEYDDHHFRVIFSIDYFHRDEAHQDEPTKSQWNTLKKKLKRHNRSVFVLKEHGTLHDNAYLEFGFVRVQ